ncbi:MAG TPA: PaaI family thioesterase [Burkholderiales bacterium]
MNHPFADLIDLRIDACEAGSSTLSLVVAAQHLNPHKVVHGAVVYALADTGMGSALYPTLAEGEICATIEIKINYFKPIAAGRLTCQTKIVNRGKTIANLESRILLDAQLVAQANGNYAIFRPRQG